MDNYHTTQDVCRLFGVTPQTVKNWADSFTLHLSPTAQPGKGKKRHYTLDDLEVFALVHEYSQRGLNYEDAQAALQNGQRGTIPEAVNELSLAEPPTLILSLREKIGELEEQLRLERSQKDQALGKVELLEKQLQDREKQVRDLYKELAKLETQSSN